MKYLIVGLGNIGSEYQGTRHNIGFNVLDALAKASNISFSTQRYGDVAQMRLKNKLLVLLKPSTYMNLSGEAVRYWMQKENIGLKNISQCIGTSNFARLRFGIGSDFPKGMQIDYVLGYPSEEELQILPERANIAVEAIKAFCLSGLSFAMTNFNNK